MCIAHVIIPTQLSKGETREGRNILLTKTKVKGTNFIKKIKLFKQNFVAGHHEITQSLVVLVEKEKKGGIKESGESMTCA